MDIIKPVSLTVFNSIEHYCHFYFLFKEILRREKIDFPMCITNAVINKTPLRHVAFYLRIVLYCMLCKNSNNIDGKYLLTTKKNPFDRDGNTDDDSVLINVEHTSHVH